MKVNCETAKGGAVSFNTKHGVWASYAVAGVAGSPPPEILYAGAKLSSGQSVQFFLNRETGLIVVDLINRGGKGGCEVLRMRATNG